MANRYNFESLAGNIGDAFHDMIAERELQRQRQVAEAHQAEQLRLQQEQDKRAAAAAIETQKTAEIARRAAEESITRGQRGDVEKRLGSVGMGGEVSGDLLTQAQKLAPESLKVTQSHEQNTLPASSVNMQTGVSTPFSQEMPFTVADKTTYAGSAPERAYASLAESLKGVTDRKEATRLVTAAVGKIGMPATAIDDLVNAFMGKEAVAKPPTAEEDKAKAIDIGTRVSMGQPVSDQEKAWAQNYERVSTQGTRTSFNLNTPVRDTARSDRSYAALSNQLETGYKPVNDQLDRMGRLVISVNQETPQADALIAPELLTAMAGGMGSGLRMNESEIARIVGGRSAFENLKAAFMHYNPDNQKALSVTPAQRQQIRALIAAMQEKLFAKQEAYAKARQDLAAADSVDEQRQVHNTLKETIGQIDNPPQKKAAEGAAAPGAKPEAAKTGKSKYQVSVN